MRTHPCRFALEQFAAHVLSLSDTCGCSIGFWFRLVVLMHCILLGRSWMVFSVCTQPSRFSCDRLAPMCLDLLCLCHRLWLCLGFMVGSNLLVSRWMVFSMSTKPCRLPCERLAPIHFDLRFRILLLCSFAQVNCDLVICTGSVLSVCP